MNTLPYTVLFVLTSLLLFSCGEDEEIDTEKPQVDISLQDAFPKNCDTLYFDEPFTVKMLLSDNVELGSYNIDIHQNFDHHTHSTEIEECPMAAVKTPVNPYILIQDYEIPAGSLEYETDLPITIPSSNGTELYDEGDYHFHLTVVDKEGWSSQVGLNIKILRQ